MIIARQSWLAIACLVVVGSSAHGQADELGGGLLEVWVRQRLLENDRTGPPPAPGRVSGEFIASLMRSHEFDGRDVTLQELTIDGPITLNRDTIRGGWKFDECALGGIDFDGARFERPLLFEGCSTPAMLIDGGVIPSLDIDHLQVLGSGLSLHRVTIEGDLSLRGLSGPPGASRYPGLIDTVREAVLDFTTVRGSLLMSESRVGFASLEHVTINDDLTVLGSYWSMDLSHATVRGDVQVTCESIDFINLEAAKLGELRIHECGRIGDIWAGDMRIQRRLEISASTITGPRNLMGGRARTSFDRTRVEGDVEFSFRTELLPPIDGFRFSARGISCEELEWDASLPENSTIDLSDITCEVIRPAGVTSVEEFRLRRASVGALDDEIHDDVIGFLSVIDFERELFVKVREQARRAGKDELYGRIYREQIRREVAGLGLIARSIQSAWLHVVMWGREIEWLLGAIAAFVIVGTVLCLLVRSHFSSASTTPSRAKPDRTFTFWEAFWYSVDSLLPINIGACDDWKLASKTSGLVRSGMRLLFFVQRLFGWLVFGLLIRAFWSATTGF